MAGVAKVHRARPRSPMCLAIPQRSVGWILDLLQITNCVFPSTNLLSPKYTFLVGSSRPVPAKANPNLSAEHPLKLVKLPTALYCAGPSLYQKVLECNW